jgi:hypothetical protein
MKFDYEFCILFLYHKCDELTKSHLDSLRRSNPDAFILPLADTVPELLPGSVDVGRMPPFCDEGDKWRNIDATIYRWFHNREFNARRYLVVEYDCLCNVSLREYYSEVWDAEVAGVDFFTRQENPCWYWFRSGELDRVPHEDHAYAAAIAPFTCTLFSHSAFEKIVANVYRNDIFSELRLGTTVNKLGLKFQHLPNSKRATLVWHNYPFQVNRKGFFHAIKSLTHNTGKPRQPGYFGTYSHQLWRMSDPDRQLLRPFIWRNKLAGLRERLGSGFGRGH